MRSVRMGSFGSPNSFRLVSRGVVRVATELEGMMRIDHQSSVLARLHLPKPSIMHCEIDLHPMRECCQPGNPVQPTIQLVEDILGFRL